MSDEVREVAVRKEELQDLLKRGLGTSVILNQYSYKIANEKGKNYGSLLLSIVADVTYLDTAKSETLHILAKLAPPTEFLKSVFNFPVCFCKEMNFYKLVHPAYAKFEKESGVLERNVLNIIPPFLGARTSMSGDEDEVAAESAMLLLGDMRVAGYSIGDQREGLDLNHCTRVITQLAKFHAIPIAMKQKEPRTFKETVMRTGIFLEDPAFNSSAKEKYRNEFMQALEKHNPQLRPYFNKIENRLLNNDFKFAPENKEPFSTLIHNDLWTNNILFSYTNHNEASFPADVKFIDFQNTLICSPVKDLIFFLFSSADDEVLKKYYDHLMDVYYDTFINKLKELQCNIQFFSKDKFQEEIDNFAPTQFYHVILMLAIIYGDKTNVKEIHNITSFENVMQSWNDLSKKKLERTVMAFDKNGWL
ncbi:hypothetical protein R5R35_002219 [Gryllus longicercus]|uniref:CHK kinase-like domain-containing protein n=1 Tax=Gryllus longicercus TaxID=2509291 RepID=A0AAN9VXI4_9ORTH